MSARFVRPVIPCTLLAAAAIIAAPNHEKPPAGAVEKIAEAVPAQGHATPGKPRKLLVFSVTNGFRHRSIATGKVALRDMGEKTGAYEAVISDDLANFEPGAIGGFDAICFLSTTRDVFMPHGRQLK